MTNPHRNPGGVGQPHSASVTPWLAVSLAVVGLFAAYVVALELAHRAEIKRRDLDASLEP